MLETILRWNDSFLASPAMTTGDVSQAGAKREMREMIDVTRRSPALKFIYSLLSNKSNQFKPSPSGSNAAKGTTHTAGECTLIATVQIIISSQRSTVVHSND